jgi:hypothetical protein
MQAGLGLSPRRNLGSAPLLRTDHAWHAVHVFGATVRDGLGQDSVRHVGLSTLGPLNRFGQGRGEWSRARPTYFIEISSCSVAALAVEVGDLHDDGAFGVGGSGSAFRARPRVAVPA